MKVLIAITGIFLFITSKAQLSHNLSLGPDIGVGANFGNSSKLSLGGSIDYVVPIKSKIGLRLHAGYNKFNGKIFDDYVSFLPIRAGIHSLIYQDIFFGLAEAGVVNYKSSNPNSGKTKFSWALGLGYNKYLDSK